MSEDEVNDEMWERRRHTRELRQAVHKILHVNYFLNLHVVVAVAQS